MQKNQTPGFTKNYGTVMVTVRYRITLLLSVAICEAHQNKYRYEAILIVPDVTISLFSSSYNYVFSASFSLLSFLFYLSATQKQHWKPRNRQKRGESKTTEGKIT